MNLTDLDQPSALDYGVLGVAIVGSLLFHVVVAAGAAKIPPRENTAPVWVEMAIQRPPPPPAPVPEPPPPEPEAPKPEPKPKPVPYEKVKPTPQPIQPEPPPQPKPKKVVQGLDNNSFAKGPSTGFNANAGNTTQAKSTTEKLKLDENTEPFSSVPYTRIGEPPKKRYIPALVPPESVTAAEIQGRVEVELNIDAEGLVESVTVMGRLHPDADAACIEILKKSRWKPATVDGQPVKVTGFPWSCKFEMTP